MQRLKLMFKTTAVRLTLLYTVLFGVLAIGVVAYVSANTGRLLINQFQVTIDEEVQQIARLTRRRGVRGLVPLIERRSRRPGANLYLITDKRGFNIAGNVRDMDRSLLRKDGWKIPPFKYRGYDETRDRERRAVARVFTLPGDLKLLVGRDTGDADQFRSIVGRALKLSLAIFVLTGLLLWFFVGRRALKRIDSVAKSSDKIIAGDLSQRLPLSGAGDEFDRLSESLNSLISRVEKLNAGITTMSDSMAHDLKTPLTRLRNIAETSVNKPAKNSKAALGEIIAEADGLIKTFDAMLMISQVESGARAAKMSTVNLSALVADMYELFEPSAEEADVTLNCEVEEEINVSGNRELIALTITNLLDNALKYGGSGKRAKIDLQLDKQGHQAIISVSDNGIGIPKVDHEKVLERFVRLDKSRNRTGSGLGLSLVNAVAKMHGGELELDDAEPGLIAKVVLPLQL